MGVDSSNGLQVEPKGFPDREGEKTQKLIEQTRKSKLPLTEMERKANGTRFVGISGAQFLTC